MEEHVTSFCGEDGGGLLGEIELALGMTGLGTFSALISLAPLVCAVRLL